MPTKRPGDPNEKTQIQGGGISSLKTPPGKPNQNKSNPGVSGRPPGPPRPVPPAPGVGARSQEGDKVVGPPTDTGAGGEFPINTRARVKGNIAAIPPEKVGESNAENVDGIAGRTKKDDIKIGDKTPAPPPPPGQGPIDPVSGLPRTPNPDGSFTDEKGHALDEKGVPVMDESGKPLTPQQAMILDKQKEMGHTSTFMAEKETLAEQDRVRRSMPSEIEGVNQGHFEAVANLDHAKAIRGPNGGMSEMKQQEYVADAKKQLAEFGQFPGSGDPDAPAPPIRPMGRSFNPYTGKFTGGKGPTAFEMSGFDMEAAKREFYQTGAGTKKPSATGGGETPGSLS